VIFITEKNISAAVNEIIIDISDRQGIGDEYNLIDDDIKEEIFEKWYEIIEYWSNKKD
jgi:hypothetical protein